MPTRCYSYDDVQMWKTLNVPYSATDSSMHVHPVDNTFWQLIGTWIGKEIKKKDTSNNFLKKGEIKHERNE